MSVFKHALSEFVGFSDWVMSFEQTQAKPGAATEGSFVKTKFKIVTFPNPL